MDTDLETILAAELNNTSRIICYQQSDAWTAYNHSAWFLTHLQGASDLIVKNAVNKCQGGYYLYCTVSKERLDTLLQECKGVLCFDDRITADAPCKLNIPDYYNWKRRMEIRSKPVLKQPVKEPVTDKKELVWNQLKGFDPMTKSPKECKSFLLGLKELCQVNAE